MTPEAQWQALLEHAISEIAASTASRDRVASGLDKLLPILERLDKAEELKRAESVAKAEEEGRQAAQIEAAQRIADAEERQMDAENQAAATKRREKWTTIIASAVSSLLSLGLGYLAIKLGMKP